LAARREREGRNDAVCLLGLDFDSTTSSAMVTSARIGVSSATGRMEFGNPLVLYRSEPAFTPFDDEDLDIERLEGLIDGWLADSGLSENDIFAGGAITTGLAAQGGPCTPWSRSARPIGARFPLERQAPGRYSRR
jgi:ethanolamine utilization protein EutA (predicted chaperonin)